MATSSGIKKAKARKRSKPKVTRGIIHVLATFNNAKVIITDEQGNVLSWASGGSVGAKGSRKATPHAAGLATRQAAAKLELEAVEIRLKGPGAGRDSVIRAASKDLGLKILALVDVTPLPHNGPRARKARRV